MARYAAGQDLERLNGALERDASYLVVEYRNCQLVDKMSGGSLVAPVY
jgi:hypothetical protein